MKNTLEAGPALVCRPAIFRGEGGAAAGRDLAGE
jgi:hypothetical protein